MSTYTLKTITKIQGPLHRLYTVKIFDATIFDYLAWRKSCGFDHNVMLQVNGNQVVATETYTFDTRSDVDAFLNGILTSDDPAQNYNRPWTNLEAAALASKAIGVTSLMSYVVAPDGTQETVFDISQM